ncbi:MAG: hypothetical protein AAGH78_07185, partial [Cyanobacteria bacterium P01_H01_bin.58]
LDNRSTQQMQQAFLSQDCLFLNFDLIQHADDTQVLPLPWLQSAPSEVIPEFGSLHPLEGLRTVLELEEAAALRLCLEGLNQFFEQYEAQLDGAEFPEISDRFALVNPIDQTALTINIKTCPAITAQIIALEDAAEGEYTGQLALPRLRDDYVPEGSMVLLTCLPEEMTLQLRQDARYQSETDNALPAMLPTVAIQTSRPKAQKLVSQLQSAQGIQAVCFSPGRDPMTGDTLKLGLMQTGDGDFHLFIEFLQDDPEDRQLLEQWNRWCELSDGRCGILVASGITGAARGQPGLRETVAFFETAVKTSEELNLPPLQMNYALDWE